VTAWAAAITDPQTRARDLLAAPHLIQPQIGNCVVDHPDCPFYGDFHPRFDHPLGRNGLREVIDFIRHLHAIDYFATACRRLGSTAIDSMRIRPNQIDNESPGTVLANGKRSFARAWAAAKSPTVRLLPTSSDPSTVAG
jgi:hypothetical protein